MRRFFWIRLSIFLRQSRWGFALLALWFALGTIAFYYFNHLSLTDAFLTAVYFRVQPGLPWVLYAFWGQCVLFGVVISIFILQALQRYNPQEGCRMLASEMKDHVIVVGHSHLGARLVVHLPQSARAYVLIDKDPASWMTPSRKAHFSTPASTAPISSSSPPTISRPLSLSPSAPASATRKPPSSSVAISTNSRKSLRASAPTKSSPVLRAPSTKLQRTSAHSAPPVDFPRRREPLGFLAKQEGPLQTLIGCSWLRSRHGLRDSAGKRLKLTRFSVSFVGLHKPDLTILEMGE